MVRVNFQEQLNGRAARMPRWAAWLAMAASLAVGVVLFLVAASLALILIPVVAIVGTIAVWRLRARMKAAGFGQPGPFPPQGRQGGRDEIIDAEYRIIERDEAPRP
ncbi:hypothetical protein IP69_05715 [Bosea sp. AAP35]|uniref:hypothetical protein n=1 Tax=Bosea sp. AAP35 TaxID=1523417 RepID=UPI0006B8ABA1|nr:hypothetical protein [Bosea sp. AAP35]KPF71658.1 hypothetical protein IP69_05715 [Bosea sp. AAP35]